MKRSQEGVSQGLALLLLEKEKGRDWEQSVLQTVCLSVVVHIISSCMSDGLLN